MSFYIWVEDNGVGIPYEKLKRLREGKGKEQKSVALSNLKDRLMLYYGSAAALNMESKENEGTKMEIPTDIHEKIRKVHREKGKADIIHKATRNMK